VFPAVPSKQQASLEGETPAEPEAKQGFSRLFGGSSRKPASSAQPDPKDQSKTTDDLVDESARRGSDAKKSNIFFAAQHFILFSLPFVFLLLAWGFSTSKRKNSSPGSLPGAFVTNPNPPAAEAKPKNFDNLLKEMQLKRDAGSN